MDDLTAFAQCGGVKLRPHGLHDWVAGYRDRHIELVLGYGSTPSAALQDCYRRVVEARALRAVDKTDEEARECVWKATTGPVPL